MVAAVAVLAVGVLAVPAQAFSVCSPGWSCVFADNGEQDGLWATNNPDYDHDFAGDQVNDRTKSAVNMGSGYMGLYRDSPYQGLVACLGPKSRNYHIPDGTVTGIRYHPSRSAACGASPRRRASPKHTAGNNPPPSSKQTAADDNGTPGKKKDGKNSAAPPSPDTPTSLPLPQPTSSAELPQVAQGSPGVNVAATSASGHGKSGTGTVLAIVGAAAGALMMVGLLVAGVLFARRRKDGPAPPRPRRPATGPEAARTVDRGLRLLAVDCEEAGRPMPRIRAVGLADGRLSVLLTAPDMDAPEPWKADPGGTCWRLPASEITELTDDVRDAPAPLPLLAPVGPGLWVDLRSVPGPISLSGSRSAVRKAARTLAGGLRTSPWSRGVQIRTAGSADIGPAGADTGADGIEERGRVVFVAEDMKVPQTAPVGGVVIALGKVAGAGTRWPVRADGTPRVPEQIPAEPTLNDQAQAAPPAPGGPNAAGPASESPLPEGESAK